MGGKKKNQSNRQDDNAATAQSQATNDTNVDEAIKNAP